MAQGLMDLPLDVPNISIEAFKVHNRLRIGWFRSVYNLNHAFAVQCFVDELARALDPGDEEGTSRRHQLWSRYNQRLREGLVQHQNAASGVFPARLRWYCFDGGDVYETALSILALQVSAR